MALNNYQYVSTVENPLNFFRAFYEGEYLNVLRERFMPNPNDPSDFSHRYYTIIDEVNESYTIEYENEIEGHEEEDAKGYVSWITDESNTINVSFFFRDKLLSNFKLETDQTCLNIDISISGDDSVEKAKLKCHIWIDNLLYYIEKSKEPEFIKYNELVFFMDRTILYLYEKYKSFCPPINNNTALKKILSSTSVPPKSIFENKTLKSSIFKELMTLSNDIDEPLIDFDRDKEGEHSLIEYTLMAITDGTPEMAETDIFFNWEIGAVSYILRRLKNFNPKMQLKRLEDSKKVYIKRQLFDSRNSSKAATTFENNPAKAELKKLIDNKFHLHIK